MDSSEFGFASFFFFLIFLFPKNRRNASRPKRGSNRARARARGRTVRLPSIRRSPLKSFRVDFFFCRAARSRPHPRTRRRIINGIGARARSGSPSAAEGGGRGRPSARGFPGEGFRCGKSWNNILRGFVRNQCHGRALDLLRSQIKPREPAAPIRFPRVGERSCAPPWKEEEESELSALRSNANFLRFPPISRRGGGGGGGARWSGEVGRGTISLTACRSSLSLFRYSAFARICAQHLARFQM